MLTLLAAVALAAAPSAATGPTPPPLTAAQSAALRCGVVFALGARMQAESKPAAAGWPPLGVRGREYFVRVSAAIMAETGASRETLQLMAAAQLPTLADDAAVAAALPGCLSLLAAAGL